MNRCASYFLPVFKFFLKLIIYVVDLPIIDTPQNTLVYVSSSYCYYVCALLIVLVSAEQVAEFRFWLDKTKMSFSHGECRGFKRDPRQSFFQLHILSSLEKQLLIIHCSWYWPLSFVFLCLWYVQVAEFKCVLKSSVLSQHQRLNTYVCLL